MRFQCRIHRKHRFYFKRIEFDARHQRVVGKVAVADCLPTPYLPVGIKDVLKALGPVDRIKTWIMMPRLPFHRLKLYPQRGFTLLCGYLKHARCLYGIDQPF